MLRNNWKIVMAAGLLFPVHAFAGHQDPQAYCAYVMEQGKHSGTCCARRRPQQALPSPKPDYRCNFSGRLAGPFRF